jgi:integrase
MAHEIHKVRVRKQLEPRPEPHWGPRIGPGLHIGFRKVDDERGYWIARCLNSEGLPSARRGHARSDGRPPRFLYERLGEATQGNDYEGARAAALVWRGNLQAGIVDDDVTVAQACQQYVAELRSEGREAAAHDAQRRFERTIFGRQKASRARAVDMNPLGRRPLAKLRTTDLKAWREGLKTLRLNDGDLVERPMSKAAVNRTLAALKAALNLAVTNRLVDPRVSREWEEVTSLKGATNRRTLFLDISQRRALIAASSGAIRDLIEAAAITGARPGELVRALRSQFDARTGSMTFIGKTGTRTVPLSPESIAVFRRLAKNKMPAAYLFTRSDGRPWGHSEWDEPVKDAARAAGLPVEAGSGVTLYTLRHSYITQAITEGLTTLDVARLAGTSVVMIEKHYGHLVAGAVRERLALVKML